VGWRRTLHRLIWLDGTFRDFDPLGPAGSRYSGPAGSPEPGRRDQARLGPAGRARVLRSEGSPGSPGGAGRAGPAWDLWPCGWPFGPRATAGTGINLRGSVATCDSAQYWQQQGRGDAYVVQLRTTSGSYVWDCGRSGAWVDLPARSRGRRPLAGPHPQGPAGPTGPEGVFVRWPSWRCWPAGQSRACREWLRRLARWQAAGTGWFVGNRPAAGSKFRARPLVICIFDTFTGGCISLVAGPAGVPIGDLPSIGCFLIRGAITAALIFPELPIGVATHCADHCAKGRGRGMTRRHKTMDQDLEHGEQAGSDNQLRWLSPTAEGGQRMRVIRQRMGARGTDGSQDLTIGYVSGSL